jgi:hypothetical protein
MMNALAGLALMLLSLASNACYHTVLDTGLQPGPTAYQEGWESAWLVGLVPAKVDATGVCGGPWARVETQQSFLNGLVSFLTLGIYSPHEVEIVCAAGSEVGDAGGLGDSESLQLPQ